MLTRVRPSHLFLRPRFLFEMPFKTPGLDDCRATRAPDPFSHHSAHRSWIQRRSGSCPIAQGRGAKVLDRSNPCPPPYRAQSPPGLTVPGIPLGREVLILGPILEIPKTPPTLGRLWRAVDAAILACFFPANRPRPQVYRGMWSCRPGRCSLQAHRVRV